MAFVAVAGCGEDGGDEDATGTGASTGSGASTSTGGDEGSGASTSSGGDDGSGASTGSGGDGGAGGMGGGSSTGGSGDMGDLPAIYQFGTDTNESVTSFAIDSEGAGIAVGSTAGLFSGGTPSGFLYPYVHKVSADGTAQWTDQFLGQTGTDSANAVAIDSEDNIIVVGINTANNPDNDVFVRKLNSEGDLLWYLEFSVEDDSSDTAHAVAVDGADNIIVGGQGKGGHAFVRIYPPFGTTETTAPTTYLHQALIESGGNESVMALAVDGSNDVHVAGWTTGDLQGANLGEFDAFVTVFDSELNEKPTRRFQFGTSGDDLPMDLAVDGAGGVYVAGKSTIKYPSFLVDTDGFVTKFDADGEVWNATIDSGDVEFDKDEAVSLVVAPNDTLLVAGQTSGSWGPESFGMDDVFLLTFPLSGPTPTKTERFGSADADRVGDVRLGPSGLPQLGGDTFGNLGGALGGSDGFVTLLP